ncbi:MAG: COX15/CtaA family protein [Bacteroidetes bacterium]|nr:COX15/CtaA family protein [Bacteroidota bacterium]
MAVNKRKAVAIWLLIGVFMIIVQVLLGGVTRLTGSGLSITEWKPIMGALPPMNEQEWNHAFDGYKQIAQYKFLNAHFSLDDFKSIFFWEWFHRLWARLLGVVFALGFIYFLVRKFFDREMVIPFLILFLLGAAQGLIGWIMVASGLNNENLYVNHIKLAIHFIAALLLLCYTLWFALKLLVKEEQRISIPGFRNFTLFIIVFLGLQLVYGAFMAGLKAATYAPTWPDINGTYIPENLWQLSWINDPINVQFFHRLLAYTLGTLIIFWTGAAFRLSKQQKSKFFSAIKWHPIVLVLLQIGLGIFTVLLSPKMQPNHFGRYEALAETHQLVAMFLLVSLVINLFAVNKKKS